jgi:signal transduction histidine kinase
MTSLRDPALAAAWKLCPWGLAAVGPEGDVLQVNPAFERITGIPTVAAVGMSEAAFSGRLTALPCTHRRIDASGELRSIQFVSEGLIDTAADHEMTRATEALRESLASIYGFAELLLTQNYDEQTRNALTSTLLEQAEVMSDIINTRFDFRRVHDRFMEAEK